jgi:hypothetical protein
MKLKEGRIYADLQSGLTRRQILATAAGALCAPVSRAAPAIGDAWRDLGLLCKKALADQLAPGSSLSVMHADQLLYSKGFGFANLETNTPVKPRSVFRIGSITKQFTARFGDLERLVVYFGTWRIVVPRMLTPRYALI